MKESDKVKVTQFICSAQGQMFLQELTQDCPLKLKATDFANKDQGQLALQMAFAQAWAACVEYIQQTYALESRVQIDSSTSKEVH